MSKFPKEATKMMITGPAGQIEIIASPPDAEAVDKSIIGLICHPHPLYGGTMHNKVVHMIEKAYRDMGLHTVRFNFRGVGASDGVFDDGVGESEDLMAVYAWAIEQLPHCDVWLSGFSFGSYVALRQAHEINPKQMLTVAPPVERYDFAELPPPECPWLVIMGDEDDVVSPRAVYEYVEQQNPKPQLITMKAGHFFHRRLLDLKGAIKNGILRQLHTNE